MCILVTFVLVFCICPCMCYVKSKKKTQYTKKKNTGKQVNVQMPFSIPRKSVLCARLVINPVYFHCTSFVSSLSFCIFYVSFVFRFCFQCCCTRFPPHRKNKKQTPLSPNKTIFAKLSDSCTNVLTNISTEATKLHSSSSTNTYIYLYRYQYNANPALRTTSISIPECRHVYIKLIHMFPTTHYTHPYDPTPPNSPPPNHKNSS